MNRTFPENGAPQRRIVIDVSWLLGRSLRRDRAAELGVPMSYSVLLTEYGAFCNESKAH